MYFDRFDICEAYFLAELLWHDGGWLRERESNRRRMEATHVQLARIQFKPNPMLCDPSQLTDNGKEIYAELMNRYGFDSDDYR